MLVRTDCNRGVLALQTEPEPEYGVHADADAALSDADIEDIVLDYYGVHITDCGCVGINLYRKKFVDGPSKKMIWGRWARTNENLLSNARVMLATGSL